MLTFSHITKTYTDKTIIQGISFEIQSGEFFVLVGPSGSGKTTLLKMINRLVSPSSGLIEWDGQDISQLPSRDLRLDMGYVLQQIALFPNMTVQENIELIPEMKGWDKDKRLKTARQLLERVGLEADTYLPRYPHELSGGEQQRIGILRAIIARPTVLLMDEPFSALDPISRKQLQELIKNLQAELGMTTVFVTHDMQEALLLADRVCIINEGEVVQLDSPQAIREKPASDFVRQLFEGEVI